MATTGKDTVRGRSAATGANLASAHSCVHAAMTAVLTCRGARRKGAAISAIAKSGGMRSEGDVEEVAMGMGWPAAFTMVGVAWAIAFILWTLARASRE